MPALLDHARRALAGLLLGTAALSAPAALAQDAPIRMELNRLEAREGACRVWLLLNNGGAAIDPVRLDLVLFGPDGVAARRLAVDVGPLAAGRSGVRTFDVTGLACDGVGSLLLNDLLACGGSDAAAREACANRAQPGSRVPNVRFEK
ncbi:Tat pathway signal protein [Muricoccus radiodurans]|uniref:Tat pathway signal protein n=1 Tax=Muricoccus radiodurans TaxID=2231721 RepID=UPI003CF02D41